MFKCTVCQKSHINSINYCDCGNDTFEEIIDPAPVKQPSDANLVPNILSGAIFASCVLLSGYIIFFTGTKEVKKHSSPIKQEVQAQAPKIPNIEKIWNDKPSTPVENISGEMDNFKKALQNTLYSNLETKNIEGNGECEIEFRISREGKLTDRKLIKKEGEQPFNTIVLNMLKRTNEHKTPPSGYDGEKIKASVYTDNGEIKLNVK